jgi:LPS sulfotransferase NodH
MTDYVRFIVLCDARTGSNLLIQALNSHPALRCFREIFDWRAQDVDFDVPGYDRNDAEAFALRASDPVAFLQRYIFRDHGTSIASVGFKYQYAAAWGFPGLMEHLIADDRLRVVHLQRRNTLRWYLSYKIAEATGRFTDDRRNTVVGRLTPRNIVRAVRHPGRAARALVGASKPQAAPLTTKQRLLPMHVSFDDCAALMYKAQHEREHMGRLFAGHPASDVWYEDLERDLAGSAAAVERFLGIEPVPPVVTLRKQNPEPLRELIANYDELRRAFAGKAAEAFFDD